MQTSTATTVGPIADEDRSDTMIPMSALETEIHAAQIVTLRKVLKTRMEESAGKMISAETKSAPSMFIAITIAIPVIAAIKVL